MENNKLLRIYNKYLVKDPDLDKLESLGLIDKYETNFLKYKANAERLNLVFYLYRGMISYLSHVHHKYLYLNSKHIALIDPEYEFYYCINKYDYSSTFDFHKPTFLPCIAEIIKSRFGCTLSDFPDGYAGKDFLNDIYDDFVDYLKTQEWFGFYIGDLHNIRRKRPIKRRRLKFNDIFFKAFDNSVADAEFIDKSNNRKIYISPNCGWELFYSEKLMNERLQDIETFWLQRFDIESKYYDDRIKQLERSLEISKKIRNEILGKTVEFQNKIKNLLWKDF